VLLAFLSAALPALLLITTPVLTDAAGPATVLGLPRQIVAALFSGELRTVPEFAAGQPKDSKHPSAASRSKSSGASKLDQFAGTELGPVGSPPPIALSRYLKTTSTSRLNRLGCSEGQHLKGKDDDGAIVVLAFGRPRTRGGRSGVSLFGRGFRSPKAVRLAAQAYGDGYTRCSGSKAPTLHVAIGTSNFGPAVGFGHGVAWGSMVNDANAWARDQGIHRRVQFAGANDIELAWNTPGRTRAWIRGYQSVAESPYYDYGDAGGCPPAGSSCVGGWTLEDLWYAAWGARLALPLPEIYTPSGSQARQWANLSRYAYRHHGSRIHIMGVLAQHTACAQSSDSCWGMNNKPRRAWWQLHNLLNGNPNTAQRLPWLSDISWTEP
jgi:hypothetical protein